MPGYQPTTEAKAQAFTHPEWYSAAPVSYTHLDVYKRQLELRCMLLGKGINQGCGVGRGVVQDLSLIHI